MSPVIQQAPFSGGILAVYCDALQGPGKLEVPFMSQIGVSFICRMNKMASKCSIYSLKPEAITKTDPL